MGHDLDDVELKATRNMFQKDQRKELEKLRERLFMLKMQDHWDFSDFQYEMELVNKIRELEKAIDKEEKN